MKTLILLVLLTLVTAIGCNNTQPQSKITVEDRDDEQLEQSYEQSQTQHQCKGKTKAGNRCKRFGKADYCWQHVSQATK